MGELTSLIAIVGSLSFLMEFVDASIGMGYGTALAPILLIMGFAPLDIIPVILLGQLSGGLVGGFSHYQLGNIKLDFRADEVIKRRLGGWGYLPKSDDAKVVFILLLCGIIGAVIGVFLAVNIPALVLKGYIGIMVLGIGIIILLQKRIQHTSWRSIIGIGLLSSFNKGISGGGYGPLVTGGQIISGRESKNAVGSTTLSEFGVCVVGFLSYLIIRGDICWWMAGAMVVGAVIAAPLAALTVKKINKSYLKIIIGVITVILGVFTLLKVFVF